MFDEILKLVKNQFANKSNDDSSIPADREDEIHNEIASHINNGLRTQAATSGGAGGLLDMLQNAIGGGGAVTGAIEGGLVSSLASKFGLSPAATGAIAGALPGILQKFLHKAKDPNDNSITPETINQSVGHGGGILDNLFNR